MARPFDPVCLPRLLLLWASYAEVRDGCRSMLKQSTGLGVHGQGESTLMVVFFGANDATAPDYHMHVPVDEYGENLRSIVRQSRESMPGITIVVVTPPPIDEERLVEFVPRPSALLVAPNCPTVCASPCPHRMTGHTHPSLAMAEA
jgi:hypothetical protein